MARYTDAQKSRALAAVEMYGLRPAERALKGEFADDSGPSQQTLLTWRASGVVIVLDADREHWSELERRRKSEWQTAINSRRDDMLEAVDKATEDRSYLGMMQAATAVGIFYDKMVPPAKAGGALIQTGDGSQVTLVVTQSAAVGEPRAVPEERVIDVEVSDPE